jgi:hypothetical protein
VNTALMSDQAIDVVLKRMDEMAWGQDAHTAGDIKFIDGRKMTEKDGVDNSAIYLMSTNAQCPWTCICSIMYMAPGDVSRKNVTSTKKTSVDLDRYVERIVKDLHSLGEVISEQLRTKRAYAASLNDDALPQPTAGGERPDGGHNKLSAAYLLTSCSDSAHGRFFKAFSGVEIDHQGLIGGRVPVVLDSLSRWMFYGRGNEFAFRMRTYGIGRDAAWLLKSAMQIPKRKLKPSGHMLSALSLPIPHFLWYLHELTLNIKGVDFLTAYIKYAGQPAPGSQFHSMSEYEDAVQVYGLEWSAPKRLPTQVKNRGSVNLAIAHQFIALHK